MWNLSCSIWDLVPWPGIEPRSPALGVWSLSQWSTREVPVFILKSVWSNMSITTPVFLFIAICMTYLFPSLHSHSVKHLFWVRGRESALSTYILLAETKLHSLPKCKRGWWVQLFRQVRNKIGENNLSQQISSSLVLLYSSFFLDFPSDWVVKNQSAKAGDMGLILGWENPLEKELATCSSIHAWDIPQIEESGELWSMGLQSQTWLSD